MPLSAQDQAALAAMYGLAGQVNSANTFGYFMGNNAPPMDQATMAAIQDAGIFPADFPGYGNQPLASVQENAGFYGPDMGYLSGLPNLSYSDAAGQLYGPGAGNPAPGGQPNPAPTLSAEQDLGSLLPGINGFFQNTPGGSAQAAASGVGQTLQGSTDLANIANQLAQTSGFMAGGFKNGLGQVVDENTMRQQLAANGFNPTNMTAADLANAYNQLNGYQGGQIVSPTAGAPTLGEQTLQANTAMDLLKTLASLQNNPFQMEQVARGANAMGVANSLGGLTGLIPSLPSFQAYGQPTSPSLTAAMNYLGQTGGSASNPAASPAVNSGAINAGQVNASGGLTPIGSTVGGILNTPNGPAAQGGINADASVAALQNTPVNQWSPQNYFQAIQSQSGQQFVNSALQAAGLSPSDVNTTMKNLLPQFSTARFGTVNPGGSIGGAANQV